MELDIIKIGNSRGVRIPTSILKECGFDKKVTVIVDGNSITLRPTRKPREGWEEAFKKAALNIHKDDPVIYDDSLDLDKLDKEYTDV